MDIAPLKAFAAEKLPKSALKDVLLAEKDRVPVTDFVARVPVYLRLLGCIEEYL